MAKQLKLTQFVVSQDRSEKVTETNTAKIDDDPTDADDESDEQEVEPKPKKSQTRKEIPSKMGTYVPLAQVRQ